MFDTKQPGDDPGTTALISDPSSGPGSDPSPDPGSGRDASHAAAFVPGQVQDHGLEVPDPGPPAQAPVPLERLEAQICELAGHLTAATCRFLVLLGDFDARRGWASWEMNSCATWLSWKCQMSSGTAREHVRVARALRDLPVIRAEFGAARLSYAKVRALTRIATPGTERGLAEIAGPMTGNQLERFARAHRQVTGVDDAAARVRRRLTWRFEEDGSLAGTFRLPPLAGAVLLKALRAAAGDLEHPHAEETAGVPRKRRRLGNIRRPAEDSSRRSRPPAWPTPCWSSRRPSWPARPPPPITRTCIRSSSTSGPAPRRPRVRAAAQTGSPAGRQPARDLRTRRVVTSPPDS